MLRNDIRLTSSLTRRKQELIMGLRGELFSTRVILPNRTYFFNVKENRMGDLYLNIVESKNRDTGGFDRQSVILFADDLQEFLKGFDESLRILEKEMRERRHTKRETPRDTAEEKPRTDKPRMGKPHPEKSNVEKQRRERPPKTGKRMVVKKK